MGKAIQGNVLGFWKVSDEYGCFSNWYKCNFKIGSITFTSSEQALMYYKAKLFNDTEIMEAVLKTNDCKKIKALGREVKNFNEAIWDAAKEKLMCNILLSKFYENDDIKKILLDTGDLKIVEASPLDKVWGIGLSIDDDISDASNWQGENILGISLMTVREALRFINKMDVEPNQDLIDLMKD